MNSSGFAVKWKTSQEQLDHTLSQRSVMETSAVESLVLMTKQTTRRLVFDYMGSRPGW